MAWRPPCNINHGMRVRYTFEILATVLLIAAGSVLSPAAPAPGCHTVAAARGLMSLRSLSHPGGRG